jgi:hypothetical protein
VAGPTAWWLGWLGVAGRLSGVNLALLASFLAAVLLIQLTPGPGMLFIVANGITGGARAGVAAAFGAAAGMVVHTVAAAWAWQRCSCTPHCSMTWSGSPARGICCGWRSRRGGRPA